MLSRNSALNKDKRNAKASVMEHRHFAVVTDVLASLDPDMRKEVAEHFADKLASSNSRFNRARFLAASNVEGM